MDQGSVGVEVTNSPVRVEPDIRIAGQNLEIRVNDEKGKPLPNVAVLLTSDKKIEVFSIQFGYSYLVVWKSAGQFCYETRNQ